MWIGPSRPFMGQVIMWVLLNSVGIKLLNKKNSKLRSNSSIPDLLFINKIIFYFRSLKHKWSPMKYDFQKFPSSFHLGKSQWDTKIKIFPEQQRWQLVETCDIVYLTF